MSMEQWNDIEERSHHIYRSYKCKSIKCNISIYGNEYGIFENDLIKKEHIKAILIFCTFNKIRDTFLLTYNQYYNTALLVEDLIDKQPTSKSKRKLSQSLSNNAKDIKKNRMKDRAAILSLFNYERGIDFMKSNHSYFANLARLLRECIECYGSRLNNSSSKNNKFYFGINDTNGLFKRTISKFKLPLLCSSSLNVVLNYMSLQNNDNYNGLLVELSYYDPFIRYFECKWLTEFTNQNEILFCGGISSIKINTIYNMTTNNNYIYFIRSMNIMQTMLSGTMKTDLMTNVEEQIIRYLVQNEFIRSMNNDVDITNNLNGSDIIPNYISMLFHHFCINLKNISINLYRMNDSSFYGYSSIKSLFLTSQNNFIKLDVLCSLFPNVPKIKIIGHYQKKQNCIKLDQLFFEEVLLILESNLISKKCKLSKIIIANPNETELTIENAIIKYRSQFEKKNCKMILKVKSRELIIEREVIDAYKSRDDQYKNNQQHQNCLIQ